jgi:hypothetical protein
MKMLKKQTIPIWYSLIKSVYLLTKYRGVEQLVARRAHNPKVVGSSPAPATKKSLISIEVRLLYFINYFQFISES